MPQNLFAHWRAGHLSTRYANLIKVTRGPGDLLLFNYTGECQNKRLWDNLTTLCRGLILHPETGEVVARPFLKFTNWHEYQEPIPEEPFSVTEKVDGSLGILYRHQGEYFLATRGSFTSPEAKRGTEMLRPLLAGRALPDELTFLFEIILPEMGSTVVKYDFAGLFLLGVVNRFTGAELSRGELERWAKTIGCRLPKHYPFTSTSEVMAARATLPADMEGYVLHFQGGLRLKLKSEAYLAVLRASLGLSRGKILAALAEGEDAYLALLQQTPEELLPYADKIATAARAEMQRLQTTARALFAQAPKDGRKEFALWVQQQVPMSLRKVMFVLLDGKEPRWFELVDDNSATALSKKRELGTDHGV